MNVYRNKLVPIRNRVENVSSIRATIRVVKELISGWRSSRAAKAGTFPLATPRIRESVQKLLAERV